MYIYLYICVCVSSLIFDIPQFPHPQAVLDLCGQDSAQVVANRGHHLAGHEHHVLAKLLHLLSLAW